ncbi:MAG: bifunctional aminoglycoside phosphotransferase/ATP-binding protein [Rhodospirillales bacterium]
MVAREEEAGQAAVRAWLESGAAFEGRAPEVIVTHGNLLFLTETHAFKMKRAVDFGWMDFSSLTKRAEACRRELALNRRTAPDLYEALVAVTQAPDGGLALDGDGQAVEWLVRMRRFEEADRLDHLLDGGHLTRLQLRDLAGDLAAFHAAAEPTPGRGGPAVMTAIVRENAVDMAKAEGLFEPTLTDRLRSESLACWGRVAALLERRAAEGTTRRCHGDLHLANIVLWQGRPTPFDCIEFSEAFACIDPLYDLAFLLMDLERRGRRDLANLVMNRWLAMIPEPRRHLAGLALLPALLSLRAAIRAKITGFEWLEATAREALAATARRYLELALAYLAPPAPRLLAIGGLSGSGKSTLAAALAPDLGAAPGAVLLRSDVLRKRLFGKAPEALLPKAAYGPIWHRRVQEELLAQTEAALLAGHSVIVDAVNAESEIRAQLAALAERLRLPFAGLWLEAPLELLKARVAARSGDASDATPAVVEAQVARCQAPADWRSLDASGGPEQVLAAAKAALEI